VSDIKYPFSVEVALPIDEETKLVSQIAAMLLIDKIDNYVEAAFQLVDSVLQIQQQRQTRRLEIEFKRRKGY
jgi:hypothetical protein